MRNRNTCEHSIACKMLMTYRGYYCNEQIEYSTDFLCYTIFSLDNQFARLQIALDHQQRTTNMEFGYESKGLKHNKAHPPKTNIQIVIEVEKKKRNKIYIILIVY